MATVDLQKALSNLSPINESALPSDLPSLEPFLDSTFSNAAFVIDTLPIPPPPPKQLSIPVVRSRAGTVSSATSEGTSTSSVKLTITPSSVRPPVPPPEQTIFTKDWKEVKPGGANPHDIKVYKLAAKDGGGAWFARRSVHEGIGFARFRKGLRREFEESLERRMGVGRAAVNTAMDDEDAREWEGMVIPAGVRGIGAERRIERRIAKGLGRIDVYHLSAQFPGPSAPRDFVTACITSSSTAPPRTSAITQSGRQGREFTMVSRPLTHPSAPEQSGFVRGRYESIEFIREIFPEEEEEAGPRRSMSVSDLTQKVSTMLSVGDPNKPVGRPRSRTVGETPRKTVSFDETTNALPRPGTLGFVESDPLRGHKSSRLREAMSADELPEDEEKTPTQVNSSEAREMQNEDEDLDSLDNEEDGEGNPVEWIMLTRSDPGGSVPRFMVERGTPGSIVRDAEKFLDWACEKVHEEDLSDDEHEPEDLHTAGDGESMPPSATESSFTISSGSTTGMPGTDGRESPEAEELRRAISHDDSTSNLSFMTAASGEFEDEVDSSLGSSQTSGQLNLADDGSSLRPRSATSVSMSSVAMNRVQSEALKSAEKVKTYREKNDKKIAHRLAKEEEKQKKLEEKHAREAAKREDKFKREQARAEEKRRKEEEKIRDRKRRLEETDEKVRNEREKEDLRHQIELLRREKEVLFTENEVLRKEAAVLRAKYGLENGGLRSRSSSSMGLSVHPQRPVSPASSASSGKVKNKGLI
ncbi:hypothetical protein ABW20_dc0103037 [Dactylellina cionopaga]|nr:hypothetical protein ABW20_dc0103037 [Dactylellina cionopaga]